MRPQEFRSLALALPETSEGAHQRHPDFRVRGKIFATLGPDGDWGMVKLKPEGQSSRIRRHPATFEPFAGAWGRRGCTRVLLASARKTAVRGALLEAWRNTAPKRLVQAYDEEHG